MAGGGLRSTKNFLALLKDWPVDSTKKGRDLGEFLHKRVAQSLREGTIQDNNECEKKYNQLRSIQKDLIREKYKSNYRVGVCGLPVSEISDLLSDETTEKRRRESKNRKWPWSRTSSSEEKPEAVEEKQ